MAATPRHQLPLLSVGQAQKEITHNEALLALGLLLHPTCVAEPDDTPPVAPVVGDVFLCGANPTGAWAGQPHAMALWTESGWRFARPVEGQKVTLLPSGAEWRYLGGSWSLGIVDAAELRVGGQQVVGTRAGAINLSPDGATVDHQARAAIEAMLTALRQHGLIAS
jgi:hypothetical protein